MATLFLPEPRVVSEARIYREAALLLEQSARCGRTDLYWPAAANAALAVEIYLKSFLVDSSDLWVTMSKKAGKARHNLSKLWLAIEPEHRLEIDRLSHQIDPGRDLGRSFDTYASFFEKVRYSYEPGRERTVRSDLFSLMDHMDKICVALQPQVIGPNGDAKGSSRGRVHLLVHQINQTLKNLFRSKG